MKLWGKHWRRDQLLAHVGHMSQLGGVRSFEMNDGWERGNRCLEVRNGNGLMFRVSPDRGMDISYAEYKGVPLAWRSPNGDAAPHYYSPEGSSWLRVFPGGLFVTGGLTHFGSAGEDEGNPLGLHGRASSIPAAQVAVSEEWVGDDYLCTIKGEIRESTLYGENVKLSRTIRSVMGEPVIRLRDTVVNEGFYPVPHMILYHFNLGFPLVSEHSRIDVQALDRRLVLDHAGTGLDDWDKFEAPQPAYADRIAYVKPKPDPQGWGECAVIAPALLDGRDLRASVRFQTNRLPYLYNWKTCSRGAYIFGVEPANCLGINGRKEARENGTLPSLQPGESVTYELEFCLEEGHFCS